MRRIRMEDGGWIKNERRKDKGKIEERGCWVLELNAGWRNGEMEKENNSVLIKFSDN
jgi:hypothetical protein